MPSRFSFLVDECEVCTATTDMSPCDTCANYGNDEITECHRCSATLHSGWGELLFLNAVNLGSHTVAARYVWVCKDTRRCLRSA